MDESACPGCREPAQRVTELEARAVELTRLLDEAIRRAGYAHPTKKVLAVQES